MSEPAARLPRQGSLNRLRRFDVRPNRELGQNFLIDDNLLEAISTTWCSRWGEASACSPSTSPPASDTST